VTAYPTLDEKFSDAQRDRLSKVNIPVEAIARIQYEVIDLKSQRLFNAPPARSEKIRQIEAFTRALAAFSEACSNLSSETIHIIRAHSFGESPSIKTGNIKTRVSLEEFIAAYRSGSVEALDGLRAAGKARDDEPEIQRKLAMRILRIFEQFGLPIEPNLKRAYVVAIDVGCETLGLAGGSKVSYAQYAIEKTSVKKSG
jgi:hypothetical protein